MVSRLIRNYTFPVLLVVMCAIFAVSSPVFTTDRNLVTVLRQVAPVGMVAVGMTFVIITAGIDLSVGSAVAVVGIVCANILRQNVNMNPLPTVVGVLCLGAVLGTFNGLLVAKIGIPDFIVTLASMGIFRAIVYILAWKEEGTGVIQNLVIRNNAFGWLGNGKIGPFYVPVYGFILIALIFYFVLRKTNFGVNVYAVGGNVTAARMSGVNVERVKILVYTICGFCAGVAGVAMAARSLTGTTLTGQGMELDVIAAVIVGGTSMAGGRGTIVGTVLGTIFIGVLNNGMSLAGVSAYLQPVAKGLVILLAVMIDGWARSMGQPHVAVRAKPAKVKAEV